MTTAQEDFEAARDDMNRYRKLMHEARDRMHAAQARLPRPTVQSTGGSYVADEVYGGAHVLPGEIKVGQVWNGGQPKTCWSCGGINGWTIRGGIETHDGCGARQ